MRFSNLDIGDTFYYNGHLYIKLSSSVKCLYNKITNYSEVVVEGKVDVFNLTTSRVGMFSGCTTVEVCFCTVEVK